MQLLVTPYLMVDTLRDWLVIQITHSDGVNVFRGQTRESSFAQYEAIKASRFYHMLAFISPDGACIESEYAPVFAHIPKPAPIPKPDALTRAGVEDADREAVLAIERKRIASGSGWNETIQEMTKPTIPAGFVTGALPSGFKSGK